MRLQNILKNLFSVLWLTSLLCASVVYGDFLSFKKGDKASYTISQKIFAKGAFFFEEFDTKSEATIDVDIEILSLNEETGSYPFDVEVTLKKIIASEENKVRLHSVIIKYDSDCTNEMENHVCEEQLFSLINTPLIFRVEKDFKVKEMSGFFDRMDEDYDSPFFMSIFGATPWSYELILTQLFHLSGEDLQLKSSYPASCYQFLNWEDDAMDEEEITLDQSSAYTIKSMDSDKIKASWSGEAKVINFEDEMDGKVFCKGNVSWNLNNPLRQKRNLNVKLEAIYTGFIPAHVKMSVEQKWRLRSSQ